MTSLDVGTKLVELCKLGKNLEAIETLYSKDIVSVEPYSTTGPPESRGIEAVRGKTEIWEKNFDVHSTQVTGPFPHGDKFAVFFHYDVTQKSSGKRFPLEEVAVYSVKNDKVIREEFFAKGMQ